MASNTTTITITEHRLLRLMQLASPALPVGAYAFSQGLESAMEAGWLRDREALRDWLALQIRHALGEVDLVLLRRAVLAWEAGEVEDVVYWNAMVLACRETAEFRSAELAMGEALARLLPALGCAPCEALRQPTFIVLFARAAGYWQLGFEAAALAYAWSWLENQVAAATKILPLGQTAAQLLLDLLQSDLPGSIAAAAANEDAEPGACLPGLAIASCRHESQYSRLFRS